MVRDRVVLVMALATAALCAVVACAADAPVRFYPGSEFPGAAGSLSQTNGEVALAFDFSGGGAYVMADFPLKPARFAKRVTFEVFHEQPCGVSVRYVDSTDQTFQRQFPSASATGVWTRLSMAFADVKGVGHWLGAEDGVAHPPFRSFQLMANNVRDRKAKGGPKGTLLIRNLAFEDMSADECAELDRVRAEPETVERVVTDFGRGDVNAFDRLDSDADRARFNKVSGGRFADGTWDLGLAGSGVASLERTIPIYGTPVSFTLDVEAPAAAAGLEIGLHIQCNWQHFTNTIGRLVAPPRGVKTIRQTLAVMAPPGSGWGYHGTPNDGKPAAPFMFRELVVRRGSSKAKFVRLKLLSLKACTRVEPPVLRVRPGPDSAEPPKTLLTELHNLSHRTLTGSFVCELTDWEGRSLGTCETPAAAQPGRDAPGTAVAPGGCSRTAVAVPSVPGGVNAAFFRIAFRDAAGREQGRAATATWTRPLAGSLPAEQRPDLPWGMGLYIGRHYLPNRDYSKMRRVLALARDAGVKWLREGLGGWPRGDGTYDFGIQDVVLDLAAEYGMCVYGVVSGDRKDATIGTDAGRARYCAMLEQTLRHFGSRVKAWEIWNEPNHPYFWPCARAAYGDLLRDAYATVKRVDPSAQVLGFSTAGLDFDFLRLGVTNGVPFDAVTTHPYRGTANEVFFRADLAKVRDAVGGRENWLTEMGWSTWAKGVSEHDQASYLARVYLTVAATPGVKNVCWYDFVNDGWNPHYCEENFGVLRYDLAPKPAYRALAKVCRTFTEGKATMTALPLDGKEKAGRMAWLFRRSGKSAVWSDTDEKVPLVLTVPEAKVTNLMDEPVAARRTSEGLVVSVDRRHPLFVDGDVVRIRRDDQFVQDFEPEAYRPVSGLRWSLPAGATREGDILTVESRTNGTVCASAPFDLSPYCGRGVQFRIRARGEAVSKPRVPWLGFKFMLPYRNLLTGCDDYPQTKGRTGTFGWQEFAFEHRLREGQAKTGHLRLGLETVSGKVQFDLSTLEARPYDGLFRKINRDWRVTYPERLRALPPLGGVMLPGGHSTERDFADLKTWGATLVRYQMTGCCPGAPRDCEYPADAYERWLADRLDHLEREIMPWARKYGMKVIVDLHRVPGGRNANLDQRLFNDKRHLDAFLDVWRRIATRFKGNWDVLYGYDLMNEPSQSGRATYDYWTVQRLAAEEIRAIDPEATIVVESNLMDAPGTFNYLSPLKMDNVVYQVHMYTPGGFTHQGVAGVVDSPLRPVYPDPERKWNVDFLRHALRDVRDFQLAHGARILVGEFSAAAWAKGADAYIRDCIEVFDSYGWDWAYHAFREWPGWSVEHEGTGPNDMRPSADNPRMRVLKAALARRQPPQL